MVENIKEMRNRHKIEIENLQLNCEHLTVSQCMPYMWAIGHMSHCVKLCDICGKEMFTTWKGCALGHKEPFEYINPTPKEKLFDCPKREDCHYCNRKLA